MEDSITEASSPMYWQDWFEGLKELSRRPLEKRLDHIELIFFLLILMVIYTFIKDGLTGGRANDIFSGKN